MAKLLVVEDEYNVGITLVERLQREGYSVEWAKSSKEALAFIESSYFDLALLDVGLPDGSGFNVAELIRTRQSKCGVIFLTAFGEPEQRVKGLELGAEDYIVKPFHLKELLLRVKNALKRFPYSDGLSQSEVLLGASTVRLAEFKVENNGQTHTLTHKECDLLKFLIERQGKVVSREEIISFVWQGDDTPTTRTVDNFIMRLRRILEVDPDQPRLITSVRGVGYQLQKTS